MPTYKLHWTGLWWVVTYPDGRRKTARWLYSRKTVMRLVNTIDSGKRRAARDRKKISELTVELKRRDHLIDALRADLNSR